MTGKSPIISVIIPVLREAAVIGECIARTRAVDRDGIAEIIVVDGDPRGGTINVVSDPSVRVLTAPQGRARQMNRGARAAGGRLLLFLHADTVLPSGAFELIRDATSGDRAVGGAFDLGFAASSRLFLITERYVALRTRLTRVPFGDQAIFIRRDYFNGIGGFKDIPIMEEVDLMRRIRKRGDPIRVIPRKVLTSSRRYDREGIMFCTFRNLALQLLFAAGVSPRTLAKWYRS